MFVEKHKAALSSFEADIESYMVDGVVVDSEGALSVMLPLARNTIAIKFSEDNPKIQTQFLETNYLALTF